MRSTRLPAATVLVAALLLSGACGAQDDGDGPKPSTSATEPKSEEIDYTDNTDARFGIEIKKLADVNQLDGAPDDFKQFIAGMVDSQTHMGVENKKCPFAVNVEVIDSGGFARGGIGSCSGARIIWAKRDGLWQEIWSGQDIPRCDDLTKYSVPKAIWGDTCNDGEKEIDYTG